MCGSLIYHCAVFICTEIVRVICFFLGEYKEAKKLVFAEPLFVIFVCVEFCLPEMHSA